MDTLKFQDAVRAEGFLEPVEVVRPADVFLDVHSHPFEAKALILSGSIEIGHGEQSLRYGPGDVFHLSHNEPHWERYGPQGVVYLSARRSAS